MVKDAESQGLSVSLDEAKAFAEQTKASIEALNTSQAEEMKKILSDYINTLGKSEEEYWNEDTPKAYQESLSIGVLKEKSLKKNKKKMKIYLKMN
ncbi:hypothetical protein [Niallia sp. 03133]|uniref:hypothetical protein n=1 Tax=Niallia sp. 03133 TaxID=3458060 RepID=UPI0040451832